MEFVQVVRRRKMVRKYQPKQVPDEIIDKMIDNASRAPSAGHTQVQEFIIVKDQATKKELRKAAANQKHVGDAPVLIVVCSNTSRSAGRYGKRGREFYSVIDGAFASMLILLTATEQRIGAGFVGAFEDGRVSEILDLPEDVRPVGIIAFGYPAEEPKGLGRIATDKLVHYERW